MNIISGTRPSNLKFCGIVVLYKECGSWSLKHNEYYLCDNCAKINKEIK